MGQQQSGNQSVHAAVVEWVEDILPAEDAVVEGILVDFAAVVVAEVPLEVFQLEKDKGKEQPQEQLAQEDLGEYFAEDIQLVAGFH